MTPIDQRKIHNWLLKAGIRANFMNFVSRDFEVKVKNESFKYLRRHFRDFTDKLLEFREFEVPIIREFNSRFEAQKFRDPARTLELVKCDHSDQCTHTVFDLLSFLAEPEENLKLSESLTPGPKDENDLASKIKMESENDPKPPIPKNKKAKSQRSMLGNSRRIISKKSPDSHLNDELLAKLKSLNKDRVRPELVFLIPFNVKKFMLYSLVVNLKRLKSKYYSNEFINQVQMQIKFKQVRVSDMFSGLYSDLVEYLGRFFRWNTEYSLFAEHFDILRQMFELLALDLKKIFYDFFLKRSRFLFNKKSLFLVVFLLNELRQFRWCFTQLVDQLLEYASCKGRPCVVIG